MTNVAMSPRLPGEVIIHGLGYYTPGVIDLCVKHGITIRALIDDHPGNQTGTHPTGIPLATIRQAATSRQIPLWRIDELRKHRSIYLGGIPVLIATIESDLAKPLAEDPFHQACQALTAACSGARPQLLHPAVLTSVITPPPCPQRLALFGYRGSGNILVQNILNRLIQPLQATPSVERYYLGAFAEHYFVSMAMLIRERLAHLGVADLGYNADEFPSLFVTIAFQNGSLGAVQNIPSHRHHAHPFYHTHSTPSRAAIDEFKRLSTPCFAVIRHPFETVLALASKIRRPPHSLLDDPTWMRWQAAMLAEWHRRLLAQRDSLTIVRYEDLIARNEQPVLEIARRLGIELTPAQTNSLFDELLFRDLEQRSLGHFNRGGNDKWKSYFTRQHKRIFLEQGYAEIFKAWGYDGLFAEDEVAERPPGTRSESFRQQPAGATTVEFFIMPGWNRIPGPLPLLRRATSTHAEAALDRFFQGSEFLDFLTTGGLGLERPSWIPPIDWQSLAAAFPLSAA